MNIREDMTVFTADNETAGTVDRIVVDPTHNRITHIVVTEGFLFAEKTVVPMEYVDSTDEERVVLNQREEGFEDLPPFMESDYVAADETISADFTRPNYASTVYYYGPLSGYHTDPGFHTPLNRKYVTSNTTNIPEDSVVMEEGMDVVSQDGEEVGSISELKFDNSSNTITSFVIESGIPFFKSKRFIPTRWISSIDSRKVHLSVPKHYIEKLPEYSM